MEIDKKAFDELIGKVSSEVKAAVKTEVEASIKGMVNADELGEKFKAMGLEEKTINGIQDSLETQGEEMRKFFEDQNPQNGKTFEQMIEEKAADIKKIASGEVKSTTLILNQKTQVTRASVSNTTMAMRLPGVGQLPYLGTVMSGLFRHAQVSPSSNGVIRYYDQASVTRNAATVAEGNTKPESAITWEERSLDLKKIADSIPVTKEAFADVEFIKSEIDRLLNVNLALTEDQQLWDGNGVGSSLTGVYTTAPAFNAGGYAGITVLDATIYDLLAILRVEISNSKQSKYAPNMVIMNPADILRYKLAKGTDGHYVLPPFIAADGTVIDGMRVVESSQVDANTMLLGDSRYGTIYDLEGVNIEMGFINDQFVKNAFTILAEKREGLLIRNVDADAFLKVTDIDAAITAITAP